MSEVGWYGYYCNYCDLFTWMGQYEDSEVRQTRCRKCRYDVRRHSKWLTHSEFLKFGNLDISMQELRDMDLLER